MHTNLHPKLSLIEHFKDLPDSRVQRTPEHDLIDILVIAVCTLLCAGESLNDMEAKSEANGGEPQVFPDFTRGHWQTTKPLGIVG